MVTDPAGTSDLRGIDVSLAYDDRKLEVVDRASFVVHLRYATRDIFQVTFRVTDTAAPFTVIVSRWPSRRHGKEHSAPARVAVAENVAFLVRDLVRLSPQDYLQAKAANDLAAVQARFDHPVLIMGDFNDEPSDSSVVDHLQASSEVDRVIGPTKSITRFDAEVATYRGDDTWLYNACWQFLAPENLGTFFIEFTASGEHFANRYQVLDNLVASRGLLLPGGVTPGPGDRADLPAAVRGHPDRTPSRLQPQDARGHLGPPVAPQTKITAGAEDHESSEGTR